jgi:ubiquinone/menaquinone biosynthesis C-methylase UbiE
MNRPPLRLTRRLGRFLRAVTDRSGESTEPAHPASEPPPADGVRSAVTYEIAKRIGADWEHSPYYDMAEGFMDSCWSEIVWPMIFDCDFSVVVDLAAGHGRSSEKLRRLAGRLHVVDIVAENVEFCRRRFAGDARFEFHLCDGMTFPSVPDDSVSLVYCFDAMVHFDSDTVRSYLREIRRVLPPGGRAFCHHSNYVGNPTGDFRQSPHWRNFMSKELFAHWADKEGLSVLRARVVDWGADAPSLDCLTVLERPLA